eukprot:1266762-Pyramimonas_sp.AAC.1
MSGAARSARLPASSTQAEGWTNEGRGERAYTPCMSGAAQSGASTCARRRKITYHYVILVIWDLPPGSNIVVSASNWQSLPSPHEH